MAVSVYDIVITKDTDFEVTLTFNDDTGAPININSYTFQGEIRPTPGDATSNPAEFDIEKTDAAGGEIQLSLTDGVTGNLTGEKYYYDIVGEKGDGTRTILIGGRVTVLPAVSKDWPGPA